MKRVLVIGDALLDEYVFGTINRVNPEASYSALLDEQSREFRLGGAANVAANIKSIASGILPDEEVEVHFHGPKSSMIDEMLVAQGVIPSSYICSQKDILLKTRFVCDNHQVMRLDKNSKYKIDREFFERTLSNLNEFDAIVVSDYNKGTIVPSLVQTLLKSEKLVFVDIKKRTNMFANKETIKCYKNLIVKCNNKEYEEELKDFSIASKCKALVVTNGAKPYSIHIADSEHIADPSETKSSVVDVVGAGDTFLAGMVAAYLLNTENFNVGLLAKFGDSMSRKKVNYFGTKIVKVTD